jgi:hypothetical protein
MANLFQHIPLLASKNPRSRRDLQIARRIVTALLPVKSGMPVSHVVKIETRESIFNGG